MYSLQQNTKKHIPLLLLLLLDVTAAWMLPISGISQVEYTSPPASNTASGGIERSTSTLTSTPNFPIPNISAAMDPISTPMASPSQVTLLPSSLPSISVSSLSSAANISSSSLAEVSIMGPPTSFSAVTSVIDISVYANAKTTYITEHETRTVDAEVLSLIIGKYGSNTIRHKYILIPDPTDQPRPSLTAPSPSPIVFVPSANATGASLGIASSSPSPSPTASSVRTSPSPSVAPATCPPPSLSSYGTPISPTAQPSPGPTLLVSGTTLLTSTLTVRRTRFVTVPSTPTPAPTPAGSGPGFRFDPVSVAAPAAQNEAMAGIVRPESLVKRDVEGSGPKTRRRNVRGEVEKGVKTVAAAWVFSVAVYMAIWAVGR